MYNLLVSGRTDTWDGEPWLIEKGRCVHASEYTQGDIVEKYGALTEEQIEEICKLPSIFAYEQRQEENPHFGFVRGLTKRQGKVRIEYELFTLNRFLTYQELEDLMFELDISKWELSRTHWAIKNVNLQKELLQAGIHLPGWIQSDSYGYVSVVRIQALKAITSNNVDLARLIRLCEELNIAHANGLYHATAMLVRAIIDHVPPIFDKEKFKEVASECGTKSFQGTMKYLQDGARKIADAHLHSPVRKKETLPTDLQVNFIPYIDVLLAEIVTVMESEKH